MRYYVTWTETTRYGAHVKASSAEEAETVCRDRTSKNLHITFVGHLNISDVSVDALDIPTPDKED